MKKSILLGVAVLCTFGAGMALADSSGSFSATGSGATCVATPATYNAVTDTWTYPYANGTLDGGMAIPGSFTTTVQTPSGNGTTLLIRPSLNTGLFTNSKITSSIPAATADVGIQVCVYSTNVKTGQPDTVYPTNCVVYDQRIQQISSTLFQNIANCTTPSTANTASGICSTNADCPSGSFCGVGGVCYAPTAIQNSCNTSLDCINSTIGQQGLVCVGGTPGGATFTGTCTSSCSIDLLQTTLSAHSFDFVVPVSNGDHKVEMTWKLIGTGGNVQACVGPGEVTVQQVKSFQNNAKITYTTN
jgi:hypothetical protein